MKQAVNWNGNLLCSIDIETSGLDPEKDELLELAIVPLNPDLTPNLSLKPFDLILQPKNPDVFKKDQIMLPGMTLADVLLQGVEPYLAMELLEIWFAGLNLPEKKRLIPLGHNYANFDQRFLKGWMGELTYDYIFHYHIRDTMQLGLYLNDMADWMCQEVPFPKVGLTYMCSCLRINNIRRHRALGDALATAEVYKQLVTRVGPNLKTMNTVLRCPVDDSRSGSAAQKDLADVQLP